MQVKRGYDFVGSRLSAEAAAGGGQGAPATNTALIDGVLVAQKQLLGGSPAVEAIPAALAAVGVAAEVDRAYVFSFKNDADGTVYASQRYEWVSEGVEPELDNPDLQNIPMYEAGYGRWVDHFRRYDLVYGPLSEFPASEYEILAAQGIVSLVVLPIYVNAALWGFVGFDDCRRPREWSESEIDLLLSLSISIGASVLWERYPDGFEDSDTAGLSGLLSGYSAIVAAIAESADVEDRRDCGHSELTMLRIGTLVRVHEMLQRNFQDGAVDLSLCLRQMYDQLVGALRARTLSLRLRLDLEPTKVNPKVLPSLGMMITEMLVAISCAEFVTPAHEHDAEVVDEYPAQVVLAFRGAESAGELSIHLESRSGAPLDAKGVLSGAHMLLLRRLAEDIRAQVSYGGTGLVAQIRFPL